MAPIDEYGKLNILRPPQFHDGVQSGPDSPPRKEHVVDEDDGLIIGGKLIFRRPDFTDTLPLAVIAVSGNIETVYGNGNIFNGRKLCRKALGQRNAARADTDEKCIIQALDRKSVV